LIPSGVSLRTEKDRTLVVVNAMDGVSLFGKVKGDFRADEPGGAGDKGFHWGWRKIS